MITTINRIFPIERKPIWFKMLEEQIQKLSMVCFWNIAMQKNNQIYTYSAQNLPISNSNFLRLVS